MKEENTYIRKSDKVNAREILGEGSPKEVYLGQYNQLYIMIEDCDYTWRSRMARVGDMVVYDDRGTPVNVIPRDDFFRLYEAVK